MEILWARDRPVAETSTWQHTQYSQETNIQLEEEFEPATPPTERQQIYALDSEATGIGY